MAAHCPGGTPAWRVSGADGPPAGIPAFSAPAQDLLPALPNALRRGG